MGILAEKLDSLRIESSSPDGQITSVFRPPAEVTIDFRGNGYRNYTERGLEHQLSTLAGRWWTDYRRARHATVSEVTGEPSVEHVPWDAASRRYRAARDETVCEGMSARNNVFVSGTGLKTWNVVIRDGALSALDESDFAAEVAGAYNAAMRDFQLKLLQLRDKHFPR